MLKSFIQKEQGLIMKTQNLFDKHGSIKVPWCSHWNFEIGNSISYLSHDYNKIPHKAYERKDLFWLIVLMNKVHHGREDMTEQ